MLYPILPCLVNLPPAHDARPLIFFLHSLPPYLTICAGL